MADGKRASLVVVIALVGGLVGGCRAFDFRGVACKPSEENNCPAGFKCVATNAANPGLGGYCERAGAGADAAAVADAGDGGESGPQVTIESIEPQPAALDGSVTIRGRAWDPLDAGVVQVKVLGSYGDLTTVPVAGGEWQAEVNVRHFYQTVVPSAQDKSGAWGDAGASAVIFAMGVPADDVVGLPEKRFDVACDGTPLGLGFRTPSPIAADTLRKRLFVGDVDNRRILVFQIEADAGAPLPPPSAVAVIGQPDLLTCATPAAPSDNNFSAVSGLALDIDGGRLFAADSAFNRVLVFDVRTLDAGLRAAYVLGQATMTTGNAGLGAGSMNAPTGLAFGEWDGGLLFVADKGNNRVLAFDVNPAVMAGAASAFAVLGQGNFDSGDAGAPTGGTLNQPTGVAYDPTRARLFVSDSSNNRVLVFDVETFSMDEAAVNVLRQQDLVTTTPGVATMSQPTGITLEPGDAGRLFVADTGNNRVIVFRQPLAWGGGPVMVLGQPDFDASAAGTSARLFSSPTGVATVSTGSGGFVYVADAQNHRVMGFDLGTLDSGVFSSALLGHVSETQQGAWAPVYSSACPNGPNGVGFADPAGVAVDLAGKRLFVADRSNHRVLVFSLDVNNEFSNREAEFVIGQPDFASCSSGMSQRALANPGDIVFDGIGNRLFVADTGNRRVMVFAGSEIVGNNPLATNVLGQVNFTSVERDGGSQARFGSMLHLAVDGDGGRLFVSDGEAHRVLVFYAAPPSVTPPFQDGADAGYVIGQPDFKSVGFSTSANGFHNPRGVAFDPVANRLFVADRDSSRVLVFDVATIQNNMSARFVLGQAVLNASTSVVASDGGLSQPKSLALDSSQKLLFVGDVGYNRIAVFDLTRLANGLMASTALGQPDFTTFAPGLSNLSMRSPTALAASPTQLFAVDSSNYRVLVFDLGP